MLQNRRRASAPSVLYRAEKNQTGAARCRCGRIYYSGCSRVQTTKLSFFVCMTSSRPQCTAEPATMQRAMLQHRRRQYAPSVFYRAEKNQTGAVRCLCGRIHYSRCRRVLPTKLTFFRMPAYRCAPSGDAALCGGRTHCGRSPQNRRRCNTRCCKTAAAHPARPYFAVRRKIMREQPIAPADGFIIPDAVECCRQSSVFSSAWRPVGRIAPQNCSRSLADDCDSSVITDIRCWNAAPIRYPAPPYAYSHANGSSPRRRI